MTIEDDLIGEILRELRLKESITGKGISIQPIIAVYNAVHKYSNDEVLSYVRDYLWFDDEIEPQKEPKINSRYANIPPLI